jgi:hypothetical protein
LKWWRAIPILFLPGVAHAWGEDGHRIIADAALELLPQKLRFDREAFEEACIEPDRRKHVDPTEGPKHYVDIERWTDSFLKAARGARTKAELIAVYQDPWPVSNLDAIYAAIPPNRGAYEKWRGTVADDDLGTIFYAVAEAQIAWSRSRHWRHSLRAAGDLCHYVGDLVQPMHNTANYRGQLSGNASCARNSVHERYESDMVHQFRKELLIRVRAALRKPAPAESGDVVAIAIVHGRRARERLDAILAADRSGGTACPVHDTRELYDATGALTVEQLADGVRLLVTLMSR